MSKRPRKKGPQKNPQQDPHKGQQKAAVSSNRAFKRRLLWLVGGCGGIATLVVVLAFAFIELPSEKVDVAGLLQEAHRLQEQELHAEVVDLLTEHIDDLYDDEAALRLFAYSQIRVPENGNAHATKTIRIHRRLADLNPNDSASLRQLFDLHLRLNDLEQALEYGERALKLDTQDQALRIRLSRAYLSARKPDSALKFADRAIAEGAGLADAYRVRIEALLQKGAPESEILADIDKTSSTSGNPSTSELLLMYAIAKGDQGEIQRMLDDSVASVSTDSGNIPEIVRILEANGRANDALELLQNTVKERTEPNLERALVYRYWQRASFGEALQLLDSMKELGELNDEMLILRAFSLLNVGQRPEAEQSLVELESKATQLARAWSPVLRAMLPDRIDGSELFEKADLALQSYPQSAYLLHCRALAYEVLGESDLALEGFQKTIRYAPRWVLPRIAVSRLWLRYDRPKQALLEASSALQVNPNLPAAFEVVLVSSVKIVSSGERLTPVQRLPIQQTLATAMDASTDNQLTSLLDAVDCRLSGDTEKTDQLINQYLESDYEISTSTLEILRALSTSRSLLASIDALAKTQLGSTLDMQLEEAVNVASSKGRNAGLQYIDSIDFAAASQPDLARSLVKAKFYTQIQDDEAKPCWLELSRAYPRNARIQRLVLSQNILADDRAIQKELIDRLKQCSLGTGTTWRIAEARWLLAGDESPKTAALVVLRLTELLKEAPNSADAYQLLVVAHDRLGQQQQAVTALQSAIAQGLDTPEIRLEIAERLARMDQPGLAVSDAYWAATLPGSTLAIRQRATLVLLQAKAYFKAMQIMERDRPAEMVDQDTCFEFMSAYSGAAARCGKANRVKKMLAQLAPVSQRWFDLWLTVATDPKTSAAEAVTWLEDAEAWLRPSPIRRAKLSQAWTVLAQRGHHQHYFREAIRILDPGPSMHSPQTWYQLATLHSRVGDAQKAAEIYEKLILLDDNQPLQAVALNNLAALLAGDREMLARSEELARQATKMQPREEFFDTLADVLVKRRKIEQALTLLQTQLQKQPSSFLLKIRLAETQFQGQRLSEAQAIVNQLEQNSEMQDNLQLWRRLNSLRSILVHSQDTTQSNRQIN